MEQYICSSYHDIFSAKLKECKSKKDYKKLCKEMIRQYELIDQIDENQCKIFSSMLGTDAYIKGVALAIKLCILERQGIAVDVVAVCDHELDKI